QFTPVLRGLLAKHTRQVIRYDDSDDVLNFLSDNSVGKGRLPSIIEAGAATPDHILNTKRTPMLVQPPDLPDVQTLAEAARSAYAHYVHRYTEYYDAHQSGEAMLAPVPRIVLVPGLGMFS